MKVGAIAVEHPIVQAGMGGGLACHGLAAAVSAAGGLGTIGILSPGRLRSEIDAARALTAKPLAVNLLLPFTRGEHWKAAEQADVVFTFWGRPERRTKRVWIHQCGSVEEATAAKDAGADGVVVQGVEAGGHVRGSLPALDILKDVRRVLPPAFPVLVAGGIATVEDVRAALDAGAEGAVLGTRFLLSEESRAHEQYKRRVMGAERTILTNLFGFGWPAIHRVVPNAATRRWGDRAPSWMSGLWRASGALTPFLPIEAGARMASFQRPWLPLFGPKSATVDDAASLVDASPLYAGETASRIHDIAPAARLVRQLSP